MLLTDDHSWVDLEIDQTATVKGLLTYAGTDGVTIRFADWSSLMIDADDAAVLTDLVDEEIELEVTRTEDGLSASGTAMARLTQHPINKDRAQRVENALRAANYWDHGESYALSDLLGDARHLCDREGWDFDELLENGKSHYEAEVKPDDLEESARELFGRGEYRIL